MRGAVELVNPADVESVQTFLAGFLAGALAAGGFAVEMHELRDRLCPSFDVEVGRHRLILHVDQAIA